jgi:hypothetical protein
MPVMQELSAEALPRRSGVTAERLGHLVVGVLADARIAPEQLAQLIATGADDLDWTGAVFPEPTAQGSLKGLAAPITLYVARKGASR